MKSKKYDYLIMVSVAGNNPSKRYAWASSLREAKSLVHGLDCRWTIIGKQAGEIVWYSPQFGLSCGSNIRFLARFKKTNSSKRKLASDVDHVAYRGIDGRMHHGQPFNQARADAAKQAYFDSHPEYSAN
jgi:hypothetical protein